MVARRIQHAGRGFVILAAAIVACGLALVGCSAHQHLESAHGPGPDGAPSSRSTTPSIPTPQLTVQPADGTTNVNPKAPISLSVQHGTLAHVTLTNPTGEQVTGTMGSDKRSWKTTEVLGYGKTYTWSGAVIGVEGKTTPITGTFTTLTPKQTIHATVNIGDGQVVGVGAPIIITFDGHVADQAAAERALSVHTSVPTVGSWAWLPDDANGSRVHWRPEHYWQPGTKVQMTANLYGVAYGDGSYGAADVTSSFTIGREQITRADVNSHRLVVYRDGKEIFNFPASYGLGSDPNRNTRNGTHITMEKYAVKHMSNPKYGYENIPEKWAVRISNNGEFIHENPETVGVQGSENVTHGCVNLSEASANAFYDASIYGDPVEVTGSPIELSAADGDVYDWVVPWSQWQAMSALH